MSVHAIVLAAGKGTRMNVELAKVLHRAAGRTLLGWVLSEIGAVPTERLVVVVGHQADDVVATLPSSVEHVLQEPQNGTGHAVSVAMSHLGELPSDDVVVVGYGDMPLVPAQIYLELVAMVDRVGAAVVTVDPGPAGFGRVVRDAEGGVVAIVEERDCDPAQLSLSERNAGLYAFRAGQLAEALTRLQPDNDQGEIYLTDVIDLLARDGVEVAAVPAMPDDVIGVNAHDELALVEAALRSRLNGSLMRSGVWMLDPERTYVDADVDVAPGARLYPGTHLEGTTRVEPGAQVGPDSFVVDSVIGGGARVWYSVVRESTIGRDATVGPFASLRPGSVLGRGAKVGTFVETKQASIGEDAKVPHLSYVGDAVIGDRANIGAGSITCNYDGFEKHQTVVGADAFVGSDTMLVAPVTVGEGAVTGAGSVITTDVEPGALAVERSPQRDVPGYSERRAARRRSRDAEEGT